MLDAAIVGLGQWGRHLVDSVQGRSDRLRFTVAATADPAEAAAFADSRGLRLVGDIDAALDDPAVAAVVIATPHSLHRDHVVRAAEKGKHVFVEKPLALTPADAQAAARACAAAGVGLVVGYNWSFQPAVRRLCAVVESGVLGAVVHVEGNYSGPSAYRRARGSWRTLRRENPAGGMTGRGIHVVNLMNLLCGPVVSVFAHNDRRAGPDDLEDTTSALLRFASGIAGHVGACQVTAEYWRLTVFGSKGWAEMRLESEAMGSELTVSLIDGAPETARFPPAEPERAELEAFAEAVASGCFPQEAVAAAINGVAVLDAIERSGRTGRPVAIEAAA